MPRPGSRSLFSILLVLLATSCGGDAKEAPPTRVANPLLRPKQFTETAPERFKARFETSAGAFVIQVHRAWAPLGADRFYNLVKAGYYDDSRVYRVVPGFMAQWGLNADPYVSVAWGKAFIVDDPVVESNKRGRVAFAKGGLHSRTTEVFVSYRDNSQLDAEGFSPFGEVVEGMDVVDAFYSEYGDGPPRGDGPYQAMAQARGNEYLDADFPDLTRIIRATVEVGG
jgi:cyclophilin family peptidyl-prolyl cis-trans isomerase